jgi:hypothetical protein
MVKKDLPPSSSSPPFCTYKVLVCHRLALTHLIFTTAYKIGDVLLIDG